ASARRYDEAVRGAQWRAPRTTGAQPWPQGGLGLTIATEPGAPAGSTCTNLAPCCHWKMNLEATTFIPMPLYRAGPCTVVVGWLCSQAISVLLSMLFVAATACATVWPTEWASAESALMSAGVPPYLALYAWTNAWLSEFANPGYQPFGTKIPVALEVPTALRNAAPWSGPEV